jgi:hypothetical protein
MKNPESSKTRQGKSVFSRECLGHLLEDVKRRHGENSLIARTIRQQLASIDDDED